MTLFISPLSEPKSELAMFTALPAPGMPGMGSSAAKGCWGAAAAAPAPSPIVAIAASVTPIPVATRVSGRRVVECANVLSDNGILLKFGCFTR
jgi:hypothetical protein